MFSCQLFISYRYLFFIYCAHLFVIVIPFCSLFNHSFTFFFDFIPHQFFVLLFKREKNNSDPQFRYFNPVDCSTSSIQVNKHHTADSTDFVLV